VERSDPGLSAPRPDFGRWLPSFAVAAFILGVGTIVAVAGPTLGYDYQAYVGGAHRLLDGSRLYDPAVSVAGGFAIYLYPPPFALAMAPFALLPSAVGPWPWIGLLLAAFVAGVWLLPVRRDVRWAILLLAGLSWPFLYSVKLGQVGPLLFLAFAAGWRWLDRPGPLGAAVSVGTLIKVQPGLLFGWAIATGRWRAAAVGIAIAVAAAVAVTPRIGLSSWADYLDLLRRVSTPVTTPHNFTPGAIAYQLGATDTVAGAVQIATFALAIAVAAWCWLRTDAETSYVVTVVASQLLSPLLWDHYAMLLIIPAALLLERRHWWAIGFVLAGWLPAPIFPALFFVGLLAPILTRPGAKQPRRAPRPLPA
jgi:alpha-1,2-mannosyltransferase